MPYVRTCRNHSDDLGSARTRSDNVWTFVQHFQRDRCLAQLNSSKTGLVIKRLVTSIDLTIHHLLACAPMRLHDLIVFNDIKWGKRNGVSLSEQTRSSTKRGEPVITAKPVRDPATVARGSRMGRFSESAAPPDSIADRNSSRSAWESRSKLPLDFLLRISVDLLTQNPHF